MRAITKDKGIPVRSITEVRRGVRDEAERIGDDLGLKAEGPERWRPPDASHLINWWACYILTRSIEERDRIAVEGKKIFEVHIASDAPMAFGEREIRPHVATVGEEQEQAARPRRKPKSG